MSLLLFFREIEAPVTFPLVVSVTQGQAIADNDENLHDAFLDGVVDANANPVLDPLEKYNVLDADKQEAVRLAFDSAFAAMIKTLRVPRALPASKFTGTAILAKLTALGSNGSLTFVDGICTAYVAPT